MEIIEKLTCSKCHSTYLGRFKLTLKGEIICMNCEQKEYFSDLHINSVTESTSMEDSNVLFELMEKLLLEDIDKVFKPQAQINEDYTAHLYDEDGNLSLEKLYFYSNPVDLVLESHKIAVSIIPYLESEDRPIVKRFLKTYMELREKKFTEKEVADFWDFIFTNKIKELSNNWE